MSEDGRLVVVGITGRAGAGKDTLAASLALHRGFTRVALADGIRESLAGLAGPAGTLFKELTPDHNYRRAMQLFGTECRDAIGAPGLWVHLLLAKVHYLSEVHPVARRRFAIPDVRYRFEESMLRHHVQRRGGTFLMVRIERPALEPIAESGHSSEREIDLIPTDVNVMNSGTVGQLVGWAGDLVIPRMSA